MFGHDFCAVFSKLQDDTTPHAWRHTEKVLIEAYGKNWKNRIKVEKKDILGSGCIGQVYKGEVLDSDGNPMPVAVKGSWNVECFLLLVPRKLANYCHASYINCNFLSTQ